MGDNRMSPLLAQYRAGKEKAMGNSKVLHRIRIDNMDQLAGFVRLSQEALLVVAGRHVPDSTVYLNEPLMAQLEEETLTDGSRVYNISLEASS